jgi:hypothetical protein
MATTIAAKMLTWQTLTKQNLDATVATLSGDTAGNMKQTENIQPQVPLQDPSRIQ